MVWQIWVNVFCEISQHY